MTFLSQERLQSGGCVGKMGLGSNPDIWRWAISQDQSIVLLCALVPTYYLLLPMLVLYYSSYRYAYIYECCGSRLDPYSETCATRSVFGTRIRIHAARNRINKRQKLPDWTDNNLPFRDSTDKNNFPVPLCSWSFFKRLFLKTLIFFRWNYF